MKQWRTERNDADFPTVHDLRQVAVRLTRGVLGVPIIVVGPGGGDLGSSQIRCMLFIFGRVSGLIDAGQRLASMGILPPAAKFSASSQVQSSNRAVSSPTRMALLSKRSLCTAEARFTLCSRCLRPTQRCRTLNHNDSGYAFGVL